MEPPFLDLAVQLSTMTEAKRIMLRHIGTYPKSTFQERRVDTGLGISNTYIKNLAREHGIHH